MKRLSLRIARRPSVRAILLTLFAALSLTACDQWMTSPARYRTMVVVAKRRNGQPVPDVQLMLYTGQRPMSYDYTDKSGRVVFENVPYGEYGLYVMWRPEGYFNLSGRGQQYIDAISVSASPLDTQRFEILREGPGTLLVRTQDASGSPIPRIQVRADAQTGQSVPAMTDSLGQVRLGVGTGLWMVTAENPAFFKDATEPQRFVLGSFLVDSGSVDTVRFSMRRCTGDVNIRVLDSAGTGVANFPLVVYVPNGAVAFPTTGADGTYRAAALNCGGYGVMLWPGLAGWTFDTGVGKSYFDGITVTPTPPGPTVTFRVRRVP